MHPGSVITQLMDINLSVGNVLNCQNLLVFKGSIKRVQEEEQARQRVPVNHYPLLAIASLDMERLNS